MIQHILPNPPHTHTGLSPELAWHLRRPGDGPTILSPPVFRTFDPLVHCNLCPTQPMSLQVPVGGRRRPSRRPHWRSPGRRRRRKARGPSSCTAQTARATAPGSGPRLLDATGEIVSRGGEESIDACRLTARTGRADTGCPSSANGGSGSRVSDKWFANLWVWGRASMCGAYPWGCVRRRG